jgi:hypothetical protein
MSAALIVTIIVLVIGAIGIVLYMRRQRHLEQAVPLRSDELPVRASEAQSAGETLEAKAARRRRPVLP